MGQLYDLRMKIERIIEEQKMDPFKAKGAIGLSSGVVFAMVRPETPDDPVKIQKLREAAREILNVAI
ncbi:MAG: hypothetical protein QME63_10810 [Actinomycetota bacterium]|nr:hypothetical protein [Actinomycetota bacterium]